MNIDRKMALVRIRSDIDRHGYHVYVIQGDEVPRYAYTIGLFSKLGFELLLAGGYYFSVDEVQSIISGAAAELLKDGNSSLAEVNTGNLGRFNLNSVNPSWSRFMLLGAFDFYKNNQIKAIQICPNGKFWTIDIPDMTNDWESSSGPIWEKLGSGKSVKIQNFSRAVTNLSALRGERITEAARWEVDEWELFAGCGPDVLPGDVRVVPLGILLAVDPTLEEIASLEVGQARWRDASESEWHTWN